MPAEIYSTLASLAADVLIAQAVTTNAYGETTNTGSPVSLSAKQSGKDRTIKAANGQEIVSSVNFIVMTPTPTLNTTEWRFTLPARFESRENLKAVAVKLVSDENGPHHQVVMFGSGRDVD